MFMWSDLGLSVSQCGLSILNISLTDGLTHHARPTPYKLCNERYIRDSRCGSLSSTHPPQHETRLTACDRLNTRLETEDPFRTPTFASALADEMHVCSVLFRAEGDTGSIYTCMQLFARFPDDPLIHCYLLIRVLTCHLLPKWSAPSYPSPRRTIPLQAPLIWVSLVVTKTTGIVC